MKRILLQIIIALLFFQSFGQNILCLDDPPSNNFIAKSPWPIMHRNTFSQASTCLRAPEVFDELTVRYCPTPFNRSATWLYFTERYSNGQRAILGSSSTHVFKAVDDALGLRVIQSLRIDFNVLDFSFNHLLLRNKTWISYDYDDNNNVNKVFKYSDQDTTDIYSPIVLLNTLTLPNTVLGKAALFNVTQDGWIAFNTTGGTFGVIKPDFSEVITLNLPLENGEISYHNNFAVDEDNSIYIVTTKKMIKLKWNNPNITIEWTAPYDFVGNGPTSLLAKGSGTTPTLIGWGAGNDKLVVVADGHSPNNMVAFWRDNIVPSDWNGIAGQDIRVAGIRNLTGFQNLNNGFQSIENSICANGYEMAVAQYNGFTYSCNNAKGVVKCKWDTVLNSLDLVWNNANLNFNNALTYSRDSNLVYGNGKEADCNYYFYGLDWNTGNVVIRKLLGSTEDYNDQGCNISINDNNSLVEPTATGFIQIKYDNPLGIESPSVTNQEFSIFPNPVQNILNIQDTNKYKNIEISLFNNLGQKILHKKLNKDKKQIDLSHILDGIYSIKIEGINELNTPINSFQKIIKTSQ
ncbi:MAG: T9SS type A sorting domain-containing protein [Flavobacterium sp.]|nr:T9SS type A sorting domain-containing protein [Flavobacterium sp.]